MTNIPIQFTGKNVDITPAIRQFTEEKFLRLKRHAENILNIHVTFEVHKLRQTAKAIAHLPNKEIHASMETENLYKSIDGLVDKLTTQLNKYRSKQTEHPSRE